MRLRLTSIVLLAALAAAGCATRRDHTELLRSVRTKKLVLEPKITHAPTLTLTVPEAFVSDWTAQASYDSFIIYDPLDNGDVQRGMLVVNVTTAPVHHIDDTLKTGHVRSSLADATIEWRERSYRNDEGDTVHQREAIRTGMFDLFKDPKTGRELMLQVFVVGADSALVERLMGSAETIVAGGGKPDA
jgi:hypothetical protein